MSSISMPRSSTAAAGGELSITAFYYSSVPCPLYLTFCYVAVSCCRVISRLRKTFLPYLDEEQVGDGESVEDQCRGPAMSGINTPHIMIGQAGSMTGFHVEDFNFCSVNYLHYGAPKHWIM
jgi:hypothetical protein